MAEITHEWWGLTPVPPTEGQVPITSYMPHKVSTAYELKVHKKFLKMYSVNKCGLSVKLSAKQC